MLLAATILHTPVFAQSNPVVRAVLFHSATCHYCDQVMQEVLPDLFSTYNDRMEWFYVPDENGRATVGLPDVVELRGDTFQLMFVNANTEFAATVVFEWARTSGVSINELRLPFLLMGDQHLMGLDEVSGLLPGMIDEGIEKGGVDWPELASLKGVLDKLTPVPDPDSEGGAKIRLPPAPGAGYYRKSVSIVEKISRDPFGNTLSIIVLSLMVLSIIGIIIYARRGDSFKENQWASLAIPVLAVIGAAVSAYLTVGETTGGELSCGPVGDCNAVQESPYSTLFGFLPVALLGLGGYIAIIVAWFLKQLTGGRLSQAAAIGLFIISALGMLFSIYLTTLEPFVIGATCLWCLSSAVIITLLTWLSIKPAVGAFKKIRKG